MNCLRPILAIVLAANLAAPPAYAKDEPVVLEPSSKWELDYSDDSCALRRMFYDGEKRVQLEMRQFGPVSSMQVSVIASGREITRKAVKFRFEPQADWRDAPGALYARFGDEFEGVIFGARIVPPPEDPVGDAAPLPPTETAAQETKAYAAATGFSLAGAFPDELTLNTGSLLAPHLAMKDCLDELLTHWGIDVEAHRSLTRSVVPKNNDALVQRVVREYPMEMLRKGMSGIVRVRLSIDAAGKVADCHIQLEMSDPTFERSACQQLRPAKFEPALDKDGNPIASYWLTSVIYRTG